MDNLIWMQLLWKKRTMLMSVTRSAAVLCSNISVPLQCAHSHCLAVTTTVVVSSDASVHSAVPISRSNSSDKLLCHCVWLCECITLCLPQHRFCQSTEKPGSSVMITDGSICPFNYTYTNINSVCWCCTCLNKALFLHVSFSLSSLVSVIRGQVLTADGTPLIGVNVTFVHYPEHGYTITRKDGMCVFTLFMYTMLAMYSYNARYALHMTTGFWVLSYYRK